MCGFFGVFSFNENLGTSDKRDINAGLKATIYRGPDDRGFYQDSNFIVGFNRLSIIDLKAKSQPHISENRNYVLVCNGEIYNFKEIKDQLKKKYHFDSNVDTEVLIPGYLEWKDKFWKKLNGMFSIVLYDKLRRKVTLIRDHAGIKPLHYFLSGNKFYFSNDYNAFYHQKNKKLAFNKNSVLSYLSFRYVIGENTFLKDVYDVLPGQKIDISNKLQKKYYWDINLKKKKEDQCENYFIQKLDHEFQQAIKRQIVSDVDVGAFISGGLDSSLIIHHMSKHIPNMKTYTSGFKENNYDETNFAKMIANKYGLSIDTTIINENNFIKNMSFAMNARGEPNAIPHEVPFFMMSKKMVNNIKVVLSGEGADELFGGYGRLFKSPFDYYKNKYFKFSHQNELNHFLTRYSWFTTQDKKKFLNLETFDNNFFDSDSLNYLEEIFSKCSNLNYFDKLYYIMLKIHLVNMLNRLDRMTMSSSIEARVPYLDKKFLEIVFNTPNKYKIKWKNKFSKFKSIFYSSEVISERYDIPKYILKKISKNKVPDEIINRKKFPFPLPINKWLEGKLGDIARDILLSRNLKIDEFINKKNIDMFLKKKHYTANEDLDGKKIWMLINLENWLKDKNL